MVEYLLTRVKTDRNRPKFENYALEHVMSYQRRVAATKKKNHAAQQVDATRYLSGLVG